jgi:translocation and assembly module TamA
MKRRISAGIGTILMLAPVFSLWLLSSPSVSAETAETRAGVPYLVDIHGAPPEPPDVLRLLRDVSQSFQQMDGPPSSTTALKRRATGDLPEMEKVLRSFGFFRGNVSMEIVPSKSESDPLSDPQSVERMPDVSRPPPKAFTVRFSIDPGPRFTFWQPSITLAKDVPSKALPPPSPAKTGILENAPYLAKQVVEAENFILNHYKTSGYPFPKIARREVVADFAENRVQVQFEVMPGPHALFGDTVVEGLDRLAPAYVHALIPWKAGEPYDSRLVDRARRVLFDTNLFGMVDLETPGKVDEQGQLPVTVRLKERALRTVRLGVEYTTDYGPGINGAWTHRNLFGMAEKLTAGAIFNSRIRTAFAQFDKPMFLSKDNTLIAESAFNDETTDAYDARSVDTSAHLKRRFSKSFWAGGGVGFRYGQFRQESTDPYTTYQLAYLPLTATQDTREDLLNPIGGYELSLSMAPYQDVENGDTHFFRYLVSGSTYYNFNSGDKVVGAVRASFGQVFGISHDQMPADLRFYAGGGGSVRGYAYQLAGPVKGSVPLGGLSMLTFSLELRFKVTDFVGLVPFLDGGTAFLGSTPDFANQDILYGAGLGLRYYTAIGPIRLDVAVPINKRTGVDDSFQIYVSIGQSF